MKTHDELRQITRKRRGQLTDAQLAHAADALAERIIGLDAYRQAQRVAVYFAVSGEIGLNPVIDHALAHGKRIYLPSLDKQALRFSPYFHDQVMRSNRFGLPEPDVGGREMIAADALDLVLAPLVVFDDRCNRIGMGGGFYDRSFAFRKDASITRPVLIGVAHEFQRVDRILPESWDVRLDHVITDQAHYRQLTGSDDRPLLSEDGKGRL